MTLLLSRSGVAYKAIELYFSFFFLWPDGQERSGDWVYSTLSSVTGTTSDGISQDINICWVSLYLRICVKMNNKNPAVLRYAHWSAQVFAFAAVLLLTATIASPLYAAAPAIDITGQWMSSDIQCPAGTNNSELLTVVSMADQVMAVKVSGDACVPAGYKLFQGTVNGKVGTVTCFGGTPSLPLSASTQGVFFILDANTIKVCDVTLVRAAPFVSATQTLVAPTQTAGVPTQTMVIPSAAAPAAPPPSSYTAPPSRTVPTVRPSGPTTASRKAEVEDVIAQAKAQFAAGGAIAGAIATNETYGSLNAGSFKDERLGQLKAGYQYSVVVVCENNCGEIALEVYDGSSTLVGSNSGKKPIGSASPTIKAMPWTQVDITPTTDQLYAARVKMTSCPNNPCEWGLLVASMAVTKASATPAPAAASPAPAAASSNPRVRDVMQYVNILLMEAAQNNGTVMFRSDGTETLANGGWLNVPLGYLDPGRMYRFEGTCDNACFNLDLGLMDINGAFLGPMDTDPDKEPYVEFQAIAGQQYWMRVYMAGCSSEPCNWALVGAVY